MLTFLSLPFEVRLKIYELADLVRPCPIELAPEKRSRRPMHPRQHPEDTCFYRLRRQGRMQFGGALNQCECSDLALQLLLVSRAIHDETQLVLFSRNKFTLRYHAGSSLAPLWSLAESALSAMTSLLIRLNCWPCVLGHDTIDPSRSKCWVCSAPLDQADPALDRNQEPGKRLLQEWNSLCHYLGSRISPERLRLTLICDVTDLESGNEVVAPLAALPPLRECTLRIGRQPNNDLRTLARMTSLKMTRTFVPKASFPFEHLPEELRLRVLDFTHLGAEGDYNQRSELLRIEKGKWVNRDVLYFHRPLCCSSCTDTLSDCCCPSAHASYSASCKCRLLPIGLLTANRRVHDDAIRTLYSRNCFDFAQSPVETMNFLMNLSPQSLRSMRRIQFRFRERHVRHWKLDGYDEQWKSLITFIKGNLNLSTLLVTVHLEVFELCLWTDEEAENRYVYDLYCEMTAALVVLRGLLCDLHLVFGWFWELEDFFEKQVMGEGYDSSRGNKYSKERGRLRSRGWKAPSWHREVLD